MPYPALRLESQWEPAATPGGRFTFTLANFTGATLENFTLAYSSLTRTQKDHTCENATLKQVIANFHEYAPPPGTAIPDGEAWTFTVEGLNRPAKHITDGAKSAYVARADGSTLPVVVGDLVLRGAKATPPAPRLPEGRLDQPLFMLPWPNGVTISETRPAPVALYCAEGTNRAARAALHDIAALSDRLFPELATPFSLVPVEGGLPIAFGVDESLPEEGYRVEFGADGVALASSTDAGCRYALITLAQLIYGARADTARFAFPAAGTIEDAPRYGWRGSHLDVSRHFYPIADVARFIDILAWNKLNIFHWHLSDDEGWRLEIDAYPQLTDIGAKRGHAEALVPQLGSAAEPYGGYYTKNEVRDLIAHAAALNIEIVPEIDIPGHCTAVLKALPDLADGQEAPDSYHSVQGYPNNALNPAIEDTYTFLETVLGEIAELFPSDYIHIGGDEVADGSWLASPLAKGLMAREGLEGTFGLQAYLLGKVKTMLTARGKKMSGWDEVSHGGGVDPEGTLLMAWQKPENGVMLAEQGYEVVMTPGQAYYLDMVQAEAWLEPGASWAGTVPVEHSYTYEAAGEFPAELAGKLKGVQACIWTENLFNHGLFNRLVFPRLSAVAEAGWTHTSNKAWPRFAALAPLMPLL
ncbi:beta-N-acetylhexosaminidase [Pelagibacterium xiamenense]|uniref:beta-N-acetylhexosaminidase n=1 Tax=Pelagibacterium xiamenense TaxID=2901140 RepID=UPI001E5FA519|nr:family 20 glycosylhydrolase [Pelagibacterium xiamenense]MCD7059135.1 family 20 glycosylhydrolase [Pelagibacterium xiamenense]